VKGPLLLSQLAIKMHLAQPEADRHELSIVNITSTAGHRATDQASIYSMSKHALIGMTKNVAVEYAALGVRCNSVSPVRLAPRL
jgi:3-oxoacyl-[acyl-carrier protein] reductase